MTGCWSFAAPERTKEVGKNQVRETEPVGPEHSLRWHRKGDRREALIPLPPVTRERKAFAKAVTFTTFDFTVGIREEIA